MQGDLSTFVSTIRPYPGNLPGTYLLAREIWSIGLPAYLPTVGAHRHKILKKLAILGQAGLGYPGIPGTVQLCAPMPMQSASEHRLPG
jgi:hypothetical protein